MPTTPAASRTRSRLAAACCAVAAGVAAPGLAGCGASGPAATTTSTTTTAGRSATALLRAALRNAVTSRGVHEAGQGHAQGVTVAMVNDIGPASGRQAIDVDGGRSTVIVTGGRAYFRGDALALAGDYQFPVAAARQYAGRWFSIGPGDTGYAQVSDAVTLASDFRHIAITGPLTARAVTMPDGVRAIAISGTDAGPTGAPVPATLDVTTTGPTLPIALQEGAGPTAEAVTWTRWGVPVAIAAPVGALPIAGLGALPGAGGQRQPLARV